MRYLSVIDLLTFPPTRQLKASSKKMTSPRTYGTSWAWKRVLTLVIAHSEKAWSPPDMYMSDVRACRHLADSQAWLELLHDAADSG
jgi:hypothetical protein